MRGTPVSQADYDVIFSAALQMSRAAEATPSDTMSQPLAAMLFATLNAWEREVEGLGKVVEATLAVAQRYVTFAMEWESV